MGSSGHTSSRSARVVAGTTSLRPMFLARASRAPGAPGRGSSFPSRPGSADGSGRSAGGGRHGGRSNRSSRGSLRGGGSRRGGGIAAAGGTRGGVREDYAWPDPTTPPKSPRRGGAPGQDESWRPGSQDDSASPWGERGTRSR